MNNLSQKSKQQIGSDLGRVHQLLWLAYAWLIWFRFALWPVLWWFLNASLSFLFFFLNYEQIITCCYRGKHEHWLEQDRRTCWWWTGGERMEQFAALTKLALQKWVVSSHYRDLQAGIKKKNLQMVDVVSRAEPQNQARSVSHFRILLKVKNW